ncbi:hypothetical protein [Brevibacillus dissolubilis]|uniref:hypothetical protein n=1 Tax=Brevibacillus dissolubilis TaxID=1844116 RepID=UPI001116AD09|nr:hypothetical protein [Brevibacillus dissolubilis]
MGYDANECNKRLKPKFQVCGNDANNHHCIDFNNTPGHEALCPDPSSEHIYDPVPSIECYSKVTGEIYFTSIDTIAADCQAKMQQEPQKQWSFRQCYCCCSCFAYGTPIATPVGMKAIEEFIVNDEVLVASEVQTADGSMQLNWAPKSVLFSSGTGPDSSQASMIYLAYGDDQGLVVTPDHIFMLPNGKLKRADKLVPTEDQLLSPEGEAVPIHAVRLGSYKGGIHHIATDLNFDYKVEGHLLNANGVVCADYLLQIHFNQMPEDIKDYGHDELPEVGTEEYIARNIHLGADQFAAMAADNPALEVVVKGFKPYGSDHRAIPDHAKAFINEDQESDIISNPDAKKVSLTNTIGISYVNYLTKLYNAFYPEVWFHLAWDDIHINSYAFREFDRNIVYISGGLVRMQCLSFDGLALILAQQVAHFYGGQPEDNHHYSQRGQADYYGVLKVTRDAFFGDAWFNTVMAGISELTTFFGYISEERAQGEPGNGNNPSIACRLQTMNVAFSGGSLPPCAGGVVPHKLEVKGATADTGTTPATITVSFNLPVEVSSAIDSKHYILQPATVVDSAKISETDPSQVILTAQLATDTEYTLTVTRVFTKDGSNLNVDKSTATFSTTTPKS